MFIVWILIGILIGLILACKFPRICAVVPTVWNWIKGKFGSKAGE